jgi:hypothetical protein
MSLRSVGVMGCLLAVLGCSSDSGGKPAPSGPKGDGGQLSPHASIVDGDSVFFVGNSFFMAWSRELPVWVPAIAQAMSPPIAIQTASFIVPGSNHLSWFFQQKEAKAALATKRYKVYVIQGDEREPVDDPEGFKQAVRDWNDAITAAHGKMMLFMTWNLELGQDTGFYDKLLATFDEIHGELNIPIIPAGQIYDDCEKDPYPGKDANTSWLTYPDLHQNEFGSAVNAYATFAMLTGLDPHGVVFQAPAQDCDADMLEYLSDKTWPRVQQHLP